MKFGSKLDELVDKAHRPYNMAYTALKRFLKAEIADSESPEGVGIGRGWATPDTPQARLTVQDVTSKDRFRALEGLGGTTDSNPTAEGLFIEKLQAEILKVDNYTLLRVSSILDEIRQIHHQESIKAANLKKQAKAKSHVTNAQDLRRIIEQIASLSRYIRVNLRAFRKIVKKYDRLFSKRSSQWILCTVVGSSQFAQLDLASLLAVCAHVQAWVMKSGGAASTTSASEPNSSESSHPDFSKKIVAWVDYQMILEVKARIVSHGGRFESNRVEPNMGSATLHSLDAAADRLMKTPGAALTEVSESIYRRMIVTDRSEEPQALVSADVLDSARVVYKASTLTVPGIARFSFDESLRYFLEGGSEEPQAIYCVLTIEQRECPEAEWIAKEILGVPEVSTAASYTHKSHLLSLIAARKAAAAAKAEAAANLACNRRLSWIETKALSGARRKSSLRNIADKGRTFAKRASDVASAVGKGAGSIASRVGVAILFWLGFDVDYESPLESSREPTHMMRPGKLKIEPKTFFSSERTLIEWCHVCLILSGLVAVCLPSASEASQLKVSARALVCAIAAFPLALLGLQLVQYRTRHAKLVGKSSFDYGDKLGPHALVAFVVLMLPLFPYVFLVN